MHPSGFIVRVYGIFVDSKNRVLVSEEIIGGMKVIKFPGGGLEYGEGTRDCLIREMKEETGIDFRVDAHFYTTDFFVESAFHPGMQVISIYYRISSHENFLSSKGIAFSHVAGDTGQQVFRLIPLSKLNPEEFTFAIDRHVAGLLISR